MELPRWSSILLLCFLICLFIMSIMAALSQILAYNVLAGLRIKSPVAIGRLGGMFIFPVLIGYGIWRFWPRAKNKT